MTKRQLKRQVAVLTQEVATLQDNLDHANRQHRWCEYRERNLRRVIERLQPGWNERDLATDLTRPENFGKVLTSKEGV